MKKNQKLVTGLLIALLVLFGAFAVVRVSAPDLLSGNLGNLGPSGATCRKVSRALYQGDLYTDTLSDLKTDWSGADQCGRKYKTLFRKSLGMSISEDNCSMLRDWLDEGALTPSLSAFRMNGQLPVFCAQRFREVWFDDQAPNNYGKLGDSASANTCATIRQWKTQGTLTPNMASYGLGWNVMTDCASYYTDIWFNGDKCQILKYWHDYQGVANLSRLMPLHNPPFTSQDIANCTAQNGGSNWWSPGTPQQTYSGVSCATIKNWIRQGVLTPNVQNRGGDWGMVNNCGNQCLQQMPYTNEPICDNMALWLRQGTLSRNLPLNGINWNMVTNCGVFCMNR